MRSFAPAIAVAMVVGAGCTEEGVYVEVLAPVGVTDVELFVVARECDGNDTNGSGCSGGLQPAGFEDKVVGPIYIRAQKDGEDWSQSVEDGAAWFRFGLDPKFPLQRVVVVGYQDGRPVKGTVLTQVELDRTRKITIELEELVPWQSVLEDPGPTIALKQWGEGRCIGVRRERESWFIVTDGDADCDELPPAAECDPLAYLVDQPTNEICLSRTNGQCSIGYRAGCSETSPDPSMNGTCLPGAFALDPNVCAQCLATPDDPDCTAPAVLEGQPAIDCTFGYSTERLDRSCPPGSPGALVPLIRRVDNLFSVCPMELGVALPALPFEGFDANFDDPEWGRIKVALTGGLENCVKVEFTGKVDIDPFERTLLYWSNGDPNGPNHVIPMHFTFRSDCELPPTCVMSSP